MSVESNDGLSGDLSYLQSLNQGRGQNNSCIYSSSPSGRYFCPELSTQAHAEDGYLKYTPNREELNTQ
jgi:hypothetical protein